MFTGIVEAIGKIISLKKGSGNITFTVACSFADELKTGQSISHNGACLTVETVSGTSYTATAVKETLSKTNLGNLRAGDNINLERSLKIGDRLDGHFVQGHVDTKAKVKSAKREKGSWIFAFEIQNFKSPDTSLVIKKGSICINGVSLTIVETRGNSFSVAVIPHTFQHTSFSSLKKGSIVNIEFDILGKHIQKIISST